MAENVTPVSHPVGRGEVGYRDLVRAFRSLGVDAATPVLMHSSLSSFGRVQGGAPTVVGAVMEIFHSVMVPTFTYKSLVVPETGPHDNAIRYGAHSDANKMAEFFHPNMPADRLMGVIAETLRRHPEALRSGHPVLSFAGVNVKEYLSKQILNEPFAPIAALYDAGGWVLLVGVNHRSNTSIHLGERLAGRKMYTRWALMGDMVVTLPNFPYCSDGFDAIAPLIEPFVRKATVGKALIQAIPLHELVETTRQLIAADPTALLCSRTDCLACNTTRRWLKEKKRG